MIFAVQASYDATSFVRFHRASLLDKVAVDRAIGELSNGKVVITRTGVDDEGGNVFSFQLYQNFPNPFNASTTVKYRIPLNGYVSLKVYNILGREIRTLVDGFREAGVYRVVWDGKDDRGMQAASGVYFYKIHIGEFEQIRKLLLVK